MRFPLKTVVVCLLASLLSLPEQLHGETQPPLISFQVPDSRATYPLSINEAATVTGYSINNSGVSSGFVRYEDGQIITFDVPGSVATIPLSINSAGDITGYYNLPGDTPQGFVRSPEGKITTFGNPADTGSPASFWAQPVAINVAGEIRALDRGEAFDPAWVEGKVTAMIATLGQVLDRSAAERLPADQIAVRMAKERISAAKG